MALKKAIVKGYEIQGGSQEISRLMGKILIKTINLHCLLHIS